MNKIGLLLLFFFLFLGFGHPFVFAVEPSGKVLSVDESRQLYLRLESLHAGWFYKGLGPNLRRWVYFFKDSHNSSFSFNYRIDIPENIRREFEQARHNYQARVLRSVARMSVDEMVNERDLRDIYLKRLLSQKRELFFHTVNPKLRDSFVFWHEPWVKVPGESKTYLFPKSSPGDEDYETVCDTISRFESGFWNASRNLSLEQLKDYSNHCSTLLDQARDRAERREIDSELVVELGSNSEAERGVLLEELWRRVSSKLCRAGRLDSSSSLMVAARVSLLEGSAQSSGSYFEPTEEGVRECMLKAWEQETRGLTLEDLKLRLMESRVAQEVDN